MPKNFGLYYTDTSLKLLAQKLGFKHVLELDSLETIKLPDGEIIAVPFLGEHADLAHGKTAYVVRAGRERILFAADSNCLERRLYEHLRKVLGDIETVFLLPYAVAYRNLGTQGFYGVLTFVGILALGLLYIIKRRALEWD